MVRYKKIYFMTWFVSTSPDEKIQHYCLILYIDEKRRLFQTSSDPKLSAVVKLVSLRCSKFSVYRRSRYDVNCHNKLALLPHA